MASSSRAREKAASEDALPTVFASDIRSDAVVALRQVAAQMGVELVEHDPRPHPDRPGGEIEPADAAQVVAAGQAPDHRRDQEQVGLHYDVVGDVEDGGHEAQPQQAAEAEAAADAS